MTKAYVTEYASMTQQNGLAVGVGDEPYLAEYVVDYTSGEAHGATFNAKTAFVRVEVDSIASIKFAVTAVATTSNKRMAAGATEYFGVKQIQGSGRFSAITNT